MTGFCDLHTHSNYSDGTCTPAQIIAEAEMLGLSAVALTDHNTIAGLPDFLSAARNREVRNTLFSRQRYPRLRQASTAYMQYSTWNSSSQGA